MINRISNRNFEYNLEALRGFAAVVVVFHHILFHQFSLDPNYTTDSKWLNTLPGHSSVLLFFILSGYVIGLTNTKPITSNSITTYLRKRLVRLYPIYLISILFTIAIITHTYATSTIIGHFFFLQNSVVPFIFENNPLWSLNSEVLYYLLFIPISYLGISPAKAGITALAIGILCGTVWPQPLLCSYAIGFTFWISGLWLAQSARFPKQYASQLNLIALLFLFLGYEALNPLTTAAILIKEKLHILPGHFNGALIFFNDIFNLPFYFYIFLIFSNRNFNKSHLFIILIIASGFGYYFHIINKYGFFNSQASNLLLPIIFFSIGSILLAIFYLYKKPELLSQESVLPATFLKLGAISYGIYVIHFPTGIMLSHISFFSGTLFTFMIRLIIDLLLVLFFSYILEMKVQPFIKARMSQRPTKQLTH